MSTIELCTSIPAADLIEQLRGAGAQIVWLGPRKPEDVHLDLEVAVDAEKAYEALPSRFFEGNDEWVEPDAGDLIDFVSACRTGDRVLAIALLRRLNLSEGAADRGERSLLSLAAA